MHIFSLPRNFVFSAVQIDKKNSQWFDTCQVYIFFAKTFKTFLLDDLTPTANGMKSKKELGGVVPISIFLSGVAL